ncbi:MAG TPA: substrate-binding domain-containing protein, partial [Candidatus Glassbacteria bacterium]|nr:substrate-binding domain-containing protein [Candidatus Glassbacteria bacterium]
FQCERAVPVVSTRVGSLAGLAALGAGRAHLAGCHVDNEQVERTVAGQRCYLITLFRRTQGLIFDRNRHPEIAGLASLAGRKLRFAERQPLSGTRRLARRLLAEARIDAEGFIQVGPFSSHLELALAIRRGEADVGLGTQLAAEQCGLAFLELQTEPFKLAVPLTFASHPRLAGFLEYVLDELKKVASRGESGYSFGESGRMELVGNTEAPDTRGPARGP